MAAVMSDTREHIDAILFENPHEKVEREVTVATALKWEEKLKAYLGDPSNAHSTKKQKNPYGYAQQTTTKYTLDLQQSLLKYQSTNDPHDYVKAEFDAGRKLIVANVEESMILTGDISSIESSIRRENVNSGVHEIIMTMQYINSMIATLKNISAQMPQNVSDVRSITDAYLTYSKSDKEKVSVAPVTNINIYKKEELKAKVNKLNGVLEKLTQKRDAFNNTKFIKVVVSKDALAILGIDV